MSTGRFAILGALAGAGQGIAQVGAAQSAAIARSEEDARQRAEFDRREAARLESFGQRAGLRDAIGDQNYVDRRAGGAAAPAGTAPTARGSRGSATGGWADVRQLSDQDLADELSLTTGMQRGGALNFVRAARGRGTATDIVDDEQGPQQILDAARASDTEMAEGAKAFRMRFNLDKPKDAVEAEITLATGRRVDTLTEEQRAAKVARDAAAAAEDTANAARLTRAPAPRVAGAPRPPRAGGDGGKDDRALINNLNAEAGRLMTDFTPEGKARLVAVREQLDAARARIEAKPRGGPAAPAAPNPAPAAPNPARAGFRVISATPVPAR